ncbi:hypothetical protein [Alteribacter populi]|uniref:hypothetical protein n=1 Tax=Alteribacter populi TaxID=2011011 RepID=UPI000BBA555B|nr:hypothetical protein [Alteribacter populi]
MVFLHLDKRKKKCSFHEQRHCESLIKARDKSSLEPLKHEVLSFTDFQKAKYYYLREYESYKWKDHCHKERNQKERGLPAHEPFNEIGRQSHNLGIPMVKPIRLSSLPKWLRVFYYGVVCILGIGFLLMLYVRLLL